MATTSATNFTAPMDPTDFKDYKAQFSTILEVGEIIQAGYTINPSAEAVALGFSIDNGTQPPSLADSSQSIQFWPKVAPGDQTDTAWDNDGTEVEIELTITTDSGRTYQRTFIITVKHL